MEKMLGKITGGRLGHMLSRILKKNEYVDNDPFFEALQKRKDAAKSANTYNAYYLADGQHIVAGPFSTIDAAIAGKSAFNAPYEALLTLIKSTIKSEAVV